MSSNLPRDHIEQTIADSRGISGGSHLLQVRAWRNRCDADWIASWSEDEVQVTQ